MATQLPGQGAGIETKPESNLSKVVYIEGGIKVYCAASRDTADVLDSVRREFGEELGFIKERCYDGFDCEDSDSELGDRDLPEFDTLTDGFDADPTVPGLHKYYDLFEDDARSAIDKYNEGNVTKLEFVKVVKVYEHLCSLPIDYITLLAKEKDADDRDTTKTYQAKVQGGELLAFRLAPEKSLESSD
ncbi:hypothetical protein Drorol1_Dr00015030 [Drosera rotundifolia]